MEDMIRLDFAGRSDIGLKRRTNQDAICGFQKEDAGLFAVADGMGGYANGEWASQKVIEELTNWWNRFSPDLYGMEFNRMVSAIEQTIEYANRCIYLEWNRNKMCGTTITVLFIYRKFYGIIYAGDSRCYLSWGKKWEQITVDEVWENQSGLSSIERSLKEHPNRGKLVNAVGVRNNIQCRVVTDVIPKNSVFLLCSDGLYKFCQEEAIKNYVKKSKKRMELGLVIDELVDKVYENGAKDNISVIIVKCCLS